MRSPPVDQPTKLHQHLGCESTFDYVVAVSRGEHLDAIVTESWGFARREVASLLTEPGAESPPLELSADYHDLLREGRYTCVYKTGDGVAVSLSRLLHAPDFAYEGAEFDLLAASGLRGTPLLFAAISRGTQGEHQAAAIAESAAGVVQLRRVPVLDLRGVYARSQDPTTRELGEGLIHPVLELPGTAQRSLPASG